MLVLVKNQQTLIDEFTYNDNIFNLKDVIKSRYNKLPKLTKLHVTIITDPYTMDSNIYGSIEL